MPILKAKRKRFAATYNEFVSRSDKSLKAKGLLAGMLSLAPEWRFPIEGHSYLYKEGECEILPRLKELE